MNQPLMMLGNILKTKHHIKVKSAETDPSLIEAQP
jgi:hypothetical protein